MNLQFYKMVLPITNNQQVVESLSGLKNGIEYASLSIETSLHI